MVLAKVFVNYIGMEKRKKIKSVDRNEQRHGARDTSPVEMVEEVLHLLVADEGELVGLQGEDGLEQRPDGRHLLDVPQRRVVVLERGHRLVPLQIADQARCGSPVRAPNRRWGASAAPASQTTADSSPYYCSN